MDDVVYDSRKAAAGSVFVCMRGANVDSHKFIPDVIQKGAKVLVTEEAVTVPGRNYSTQGRERQKCPVPAFGCPLWLSCQKMTTIGVTGTKGKTTTTYMIKAILEAAGEKTGLIGTNGAIIGSDHFPTMNTTPESYIPQEYFAKMVEQGCRYMVMEVSSQSYLMHRVDGIFSITPSSLIFPTIISVQMSMPALRNICTIKTVTFAEQPCLPCKQG